MIYKKRIFSYISDEKKNVYFVYIEGGGTEKKLFYFFKSKMKMKFKMKVLRRKTFHILFLIFKTLLGNKFNLLKVKIR